MDTVATRIAATLTAAEISVLTAVPGHGVGEIVAAWGATRPRTPWTWSFREEVAFTLAHGAALTGSRAVTVMQAPGVLKAAGALVGALATGTTAALVLLVAHDPTGARSGGILDIRGLLRALGVPTYGFTAEEASTAVAWAIQMSESRGLPVALVVDAEALAAPLPRGEPSLPRGSCPQYWREPARHLVMPALAAYQRGVLEARQKGQDPDAVPVPPLPRVPDDLPGPLRVQAERLVPLMSAFQEIRGPLVAADPGLACHFGLPPFTCVDLCTCPGGGIPLALGAALAGRNPSWAITDDFTFVAAGHQGLVEAVHRGIPPRVMILWNGEATSAGGRSVPETLLERLLLPYRDLVRPIRKGDMATPILAEAATSPTGRIVVVDLRSE